MIMKPSEIAELTYEDFDKPFEIEGYLIISGELTHIVDIGAYESKKPHYGILLAPKLLKDLIEKDLPQSVGTRVHSEGKIKLKATVTYTGYSILPVSIGYIYNYSFENKHCNYDFYQSDTYKDVRFKSPENISAAMLSDLKSVNTVFKSISIMELKKHLAEKDDILVAEHIEGEELQRLLKTLDTHQLQYEVTECPIRFGMP